MAFQDVSELQGKNFKKSTEIEIGESIQGYLLGSKEGQYGPILQMKVAGEDVNLATSGNLKYMVKDNKLKMGLMTKIVRIADEKFTTKDGQKAKKTMFKVEQDPEDAMAGVAQTATVSSADSFKDKIAALKAGGK